MPSFPFTWFNLQDSSIGELSAEISAGATSLTVKSGQGIKFPASDFIVRCGSEWIHCATRTTDTFNALTRGYDGTTAAIHAINSVVFQSAGKSLFQRLYDNLNAHTHPKADIPDFAHNHAQGDITSLVSDLAGKAASSHTHVAGDVTGTAVLTADSRLSDARTPLTHNITSAHNGFPGGTTNFLRADGTFAAPPGGGGPQTLKTTANQTINAGAGVYVDVTGLTFAVVSGTDYAFDFYIVFRAAATTTGHKVSVNCPAGTLDFFCTNQTIANASTAGVATWLQRHSVTRDDMTLLTATITAGVDLVVMIKGRYMCTANGTFAIRFANELASNTGLVVQKGSWGVYF